MYLFLIYLLVLTVYNPSIMGLNLSNYILVCAVVLALFVGNRKFHKFRKNSLNVAVAVFYIWIIISNIYSVNHILTIENTIKVSLLIVFGFFLDLVVKNKNDEYKMWDYIICGNIASCMVGLYQLVFHTSTYHLAYGTEFDALRIVGAFPTPNIFANFICLSLPIILLKAIKEKKIIWFILLAMNGVVLYESYSRGSVLALVLSVIIWKIIDSFFISKNWVITKKKAGFIVAITIVVFIVIRKLIVSGKLAFLFQTRGSNTIRANSIITAFRMFLDNPLGRGFGVGIGDILDGAILNVLVDLGVIGAVLLLAVMATMLSKSIKMCKKSNDIYAQSVLLTVIILFFLCILENVIYDTLINFFAAIIWYELNYHRPEMAEYMISEMRNG